MQKISRNTSNIKLNIQSICTHSVYETRNVFHFHFPFRRLTKVFCMKIFNEPIKAQAHKSIEKNDNNNNTNVNVRKMHKIILLKHLIFKS